MAPAPEPVQPTASLNTNEELERLLDRADQLVTSGRSDLAPVLWQRVLDEAGDVLASSAGGSTETRRHVYQSYRPLREETLRRMATAGPEALKAYRLQMDGVAKLRLADETVDRNATLADVVQRLLLTTPGPEAAFELACLRLEDGDPLSTIRLLTALERVPDHGLAPAAISARMTAALARVGAIDAAHDRLEKEAAFSVELRTRLAADLGRWATPSRTVTMTPVAPTIARAGDAVLTEAWHETLPYVLKAPPPQPDSRNRQMIVANINGRQVAVAIDNQGRVVQPSADDPNAKDLKPADLQRAWTEGKWQPVLQGHLAGDRVLVKSQDRLVCLDRRTGRTIWMGRRNEYPRAAASVESQQAIFVRRAISDEQGPRAPQTATEVNLFGDLVPQLVTVDDNLVFNIEGSLNYSTPVKFKRENEPPRNPFGIDLESIPAAGRKTWLAAYELRTGKLRWHRSPNEADANAAPAGFVSAPTPFHELLICAVNDGQRLSLMALDRQTGATRWRTSLCDVPATGTAAWSPVGVAVEQGEVFVATGAGVIFFLNGLDGSVRQALTYPRKVSAARLRQQAMLAGEPVPPISSRAECRENRIIPAENAVVVLATDSDYLFAIDRRTAAIRWEAPLAPQLQSDAAVQCLGQAGRMLVLAGTASVRGYDLLGGRIVWETPLSSSLGRGTVTDSAVYVPDGQQILALDPKTGKRLGAMTLTLADGAPVGNLLVDGNRLIVIGAGTVSSWSRTPMDSSDGAMP